MVAMSSGCLETYGDRAETRWYNPEQDLVLCLCLGQRDGSMALVCHQQVQGALEQCHAKKCSLLLLRLLPPVLCSSFLCQEPLWASTFPLGYTNNSSEAEERTPAEV